MALLNIDLFFQQADGVNAAGVRVTRGTVIIAPNAEYNTGSGLMTEMPFNATPGAQVKLESGVWDFQLVVPNGDGQGGDFIRTSTRRVPTAYPVGLTSIQIDDLEAVLPIPAGTPGAGALPPDWQAYVDLKDAQLLAAIQAISGGAPVGSGPAGQLIAVDVWDSTDVGRSVLTAPGASLANRQLAARTALDVASQTAVTNAQNVANTALSNAATADGKAVTAQTAAATAQSTASAASTIASAASTAATTATTNVSALTTTVAGKTTTPTLAAGQYLPLVVITSDPNAVRPSYAGLNTSVTWFVPVGVVPVNAIAGVDRLFVVNTQ